MIEDYGKSAPHSSTFRITHPDFNHGLLDEFRHLQLVELDRTCEPCAQKKKCQVRHDRCFKARNFLQDIAKIVARRSGYRITSYCGINQ